MLLIQHNRDVYVKMSITTLMHAYEYIETPEQHSVIWIKLAILGIFLHWNGIDLANNGLILLEISKHGIKYIFPVMKFALPVAQSAKN